MGEVQKGVYHGKGLFYRKSNNTWELNEYHEGRVVKPIKAGEGKPQSLEISKEIMSDSQFDEIYIKPKDYFFDHYEVRIHL
jgi:hypothetical protein